MERAGGMVKLEIEMVYGELFLSYGKIMNLKN